MGRAGGEMGVQALHVQKRIGKEQLQGDADTMRTPGEQVHSVIMAGTQLTHDRQERSGTYVYGLVSSTSFIKEDSPEIRNRGSVEEAVTKATPTPNSDSGS